MDNATVMGEVSSSRESLKERLVTLTEALNSVEKEKKAAMKNYSDQIKDIKEEIGGTLELLKEAQ